MKIEKLPSGSYRIRKMYQGKTYSVITDYKPTQKEAIQLMADKLDQVQEKYERMTFRRAADEYISAKRNILSPSTIQGYEKIIRCTSNLFLDKNVHDITTMDVQTEINRVAKGHSPKTTRNHHGFISAVLNVFRPNLKLTTTLPQKVKNEPYIPSDEEIRLILEYARDTKYEIPLILACYGMRRSEICALTPEDINGDIVTINKALVQGPNREWVTKSTKTTSSTREIIIPAEIADRIRWQGYVYNGYPGKINIFLESTQQKLGIPHFPLHKLRHYFASKMSALNIPEADILKMGGWETDHIMKSVYRHSMMEKEVNAKRNAAEKLRNSLFS